MPPPPRCSAVWVQDCSWSRGTPRRPFSWFSDQREWISLAFMMSEQFWISHDPQVKTRRGVNSPVNSPLCQSFFKFDFLTQSRCYCLLFRILRYQLLISVQLERNTLVGFLHLGQHQKPSIVVLSLYILLSFIVHPNQGGLQSVHLSFISQDRALTETKYQWLNQDRIPFFSRSCLKVQDGRVVLLACPAVSTTGARRLLQFSSFLS